MELLADAIETPIGRLWCLERDGAAVGLSFDDRRGSVETHLRRHLGPLSVRDRPGLASGVALARYFRGDLAALAQIEVALVGTDFQRAVWAELQCIPCGVAISYGELAARLGRPTAVRAVGTANGANPVPVAVPCHRVIGGDGSLTGYGGGLDRKRWLLVHEGVALADAVTTAQQSLPL